MTQPIGNGEPTLKQKLKLLVNNVGAPQIVKDSLIKEIEVAGATASTMNKIVQALETEKDIITLTISSVNNLKTQSGPNTSTQPSKKVAPAVTPANTTPSVSPQLATPAPTRTPSQPASTPVANTNYVADQANTQTGTNNTSSKAEKEELDKLVKELRQLQSNKK